MMLELEIFDGGIKPTIILKDLIYWVIHDNTEITSKHKVVYYKYKGR